MRLAIVCLVVAFMVVGSALLYAQNNMPIMQTFIGSYGNSWFGDKFVSLDFNQDSIHDLVIYTKKNGISALSAALIFYGSTDMDTIPDLILQSQFQTQVYKRMFLNAGDVNGDGFDDLLIQENYQAPNDTCKINFYYSNQSPDLLPDHTIVTTKYLGDPRLCVTTSLGDVNDDGYDDLGCVTFEGNDSENLNLEILLGGIWQRVVVIGHSVSSMARYRTINGVGDVNGDGIDDFVVGYASNTAQGVESYRYLYFGGNPLNLNNRILLYQTLDSGQWFAGAYGVGDFNNDGYDDFVYCTGNSYMDGNKLRLGGSNILSTPEITLHSHEWYNLINLEWGSPVFGDFNGDGCSDICGADYGEITWIGTGGIWLGKTTPNGDYDLRLIRPATSPYHQFGWATAAGDFNGDGFCDVAISAPNSQDSDPYYKGYVYILAGNAQLHDTSVAVDDHVETPHVSTVDVRYYPNPLNLHNNQLVDFYVNGKMPDSITTANILIYNNKGQAVSAYNINPDDLLSQNGSLKLSDLPSGVYIVLLQINGKTVSNEKIALY